MLAPWIELAGGAHRVTASSSWPGEYALPIAGAAEFVACWPEWGSLAEPWALARAWGLEPWGLAWA